MREEVGGMMTASNAASMPRGQQQVSDVRRHLKFGAQGGDTSELAMLMIKCKAANSDAFVRCVQAAPEPLCILATDYHLQELENNCANSHNFGVLSLDPTFDLGKFYVTPMVFPLRCSTAREQESHLIISPPPSYPSDPEGASLLLFLLTACWNEVVIA